MKIEEVRCVLSTSIDSSLTQLSMSLTTAKYDPQDSSEDHMNVDDAYQGFENPDYFKAEAVEEVIRKPDTVKKQRLMDAHNEYFEFQAKKDAILKNQPVR